MRALVRLAIVVAATTVVVVPRVIAIECRGDLRWGRGGPQLATAIAGAILLTADDTSSYLDALRAERNEREGAAFRRSHTGAP